VSGEAILNAENSGKTLGGRGSVLLGELIALPQPPSWWEGGCCPFPKNPTIALGLRRFGLAPMKNPGDVTR